MRSGLTTHDLQDCNNSVPGIGLGANGIGINVAHLTYMGMSTGNPLDAGAAACGGKPPGLIGVIGGLLGLRGGDGKSAASIFQDALAESEGEDADGDGDVARKQAEGGEGGSVETSAAGRVEGGLVAVGMVVFGAVVFV